jgi:hypothetical protein
MNEIKTASMAMSVTKVKAIMAIHIYSLDIYFLDIYFLLYYNMSWFFGKSDIPSPLDTPKLPPEQDATNKKVKTDSIQKHRDAINPTENIRRESILDSLNLSNSSVLKKENDNSLKYMLYLVNSRINYYSYDSQKLGEYTDKKKLIEKEQDDRKIRERQQQIQIIANKVPLDKGKVALDIAANYWGLGALRGGRRRKRNKRTMKKRIMKKRTKRRNN